MLGVGRRRYAMSLRTKSRIPASTSEAATDSVSSSIVSIFSERMAFICFFPCFASVASAESPRTTNLTPPSGLPILAGSRPIYGNAGAFAGLVGDRLPALFEAGGDAFVGDAQRRLRDRARNIEAADDLLLGADFAQPFVFGGGQALAGGKARAGIGQAELCGLLGPVNRAASRSRQRRQPLGHVIAVLEGERIFLAELERLAQGRAQLALVLRGVDPCFDCRLVPDRANASRADRGPRRAGGLRLVAAIAGLLGQQFRKRCRLPHHSHVGAHLRIEERRDRLLDRDRRPVGIFLGRPYHLAGSRLAR